MTDEYTAITFAPVQGFIEKSRKLRDLYGSSFILSYLARELCEEAKRYLENADAIISPAIINLTQGTPNQILIRGNFPEKDAKKALNNTWKGITQGCRTWIEQQLPNKYCWQNEWNAWANHAWEFFWQQGDSISNVRQELNNTKRARDWTGINWQGESSTLSGADAIAFPSMSLNLSPKEQSAEISKFYNQLGTISSLGEAFVDATEQLSIPELIKRLITYKEVKSYLNISSERIPDVEIPQTFRNLSRFEDNRWTGWFQGDGDSIGNHLRSLADAGDESAALNKFSYKMVNWAKDSLIPSVKKNNGRIIYAGGDDFLGVFYRTTPEPKLKVTEVLHWLYQFEPKVWKAHGENITVSVGFVWTAAGVPQRDVLQHCKEAEQSAKKHGRNRTALRVLFNGGNYIEWVCPWQFLEQILENYCDRNGNKGFANKPNWTHIYNDVAALESRHAFAGKQSEVALGLFNIYFANASNILESNLWNADTESGILGNKNPKQCEHQAINNWIINLAKVGFHLCSDT
jgi:CRISPR-associated protein Cmr2